MPVLGSSLVGNVLGKVHDGGSRFSSLDRRVNPLCLVFLDGWGIGFAWKGVDGVPFRYLRHVVFA